MEGILYVKNMVCGRCIMAVDHILKSLGISHHKIRIGEIHLCTSLKKSAEDELRARLEAIAGSPVYLY